MIIDIIGMFLVFAWCIFICYKLTKTSKKHRKAIKKLDEINRELERLNRL